MTHFQAGTEIPTPMSGATSPTWLPVVPDAIPRELTYDRSWYPAAIKPKVGKVGHWDKIPSDPTTGRPAHWSDPTTRVSFSAKSSADKSIAIRSFNQL